jgi:hypothetical protein
VFKDEFEAFKDVPLVQILEMRTVGFAAVFPMMRGEKFPVQLNESELIDVDALLLQADRTKFTPRPRSCQTRNIIELAII